MVELPNLKERKELLFEGQDPYKDSRGEITNYYLSEGINMVGLITSKKGTLRANHFHPVQEQKCILISGKFISVFKDLLVENGKIHKQVVNAGQMSVMPPMVAHTMIFLEDSVFVNLVNGNRDHDKFGEHTIPYELVKKDEIQKYIEQMS